MSVLSSLMRFFGSSVGAANGSAVNYRSHVAARTKLQELPHRALYDLLKSGYLQNGFYDDLRAGNYSATVATPQIKAIRNPISAVVDVLGSKIYPEPLIVTTPLTAGITSQVERQKVEESDPIKAAIDQVHQWSNWPRAKRKHARWTALYGEAWVKVVADMDVGRVFFELIEPQYVTDYTVDVRDFVTMARLDIPQCEVTQAGRRNWTHTEVWSKDLQSCRIWQTDGDASERRVEDLGSVYDEFPLIDLGIDFVPLVRTPFREIDDGRAIGAVQLALEAIIEADLSATNLHSMVYVDAEGAWVLKSVGVDGFGRPIPPPQVGAASSDGAPGKQSDGSVMVGKRSFWRLGGNQELQSVVADIDYPGALAILQEHGAHLKRLMPAIAYLEISELSGGDLSGKAITYKMRAFQDQVEEARSNVLASLKQADMMALTMGAAAGIFADLGGTYESGAFEHDFEDQPILPVNSMDESEEKRTLAQAAQALSAAGIPMSFVLTDTLGITEEAATELVDAAAAEAEAAFEQQQELAAARPAQPDNGFGGDA